MTFIFTQDRIEDKYVSCEEGFSMNNERKLFSRIGFVYTIFFALTIIAQILWTFILKLVHLEQDHSVLVLFLTMTVPMYLIAFPAFFILCHAIPSRAPAERVRFHWSSWLGIIIICIGATYWFNLMGQGVMRLVDFMLRRPSVNGVQDLIQELNPVVVFLAAVIVAPIMEEIMFRKLLIDRMSGFSDATAILVSGFMFGIAHGNFYQFFYAFALGAIFAYVYRKTGNVIHTILLHMMINFIGSIVPVFIIKFSESRFVVLSSLLVILFGLGIFIFMVLSLVVLGYFIPRLSLQPGEISMQGKGLSTVFLNPGMFVFLVGGIILFLL